MPIYKAIKYITKYSDKKLKKMNYFYFQYLQMVVTTLGGAKCKCSELSERAWINIFHSLGTKILESRQYLGSSSIKNL